jgi:FkbM family methyltransferase
MMSDSKKAMYESTSIRRRNVPTAPGKALDFVNRIERMRWVPRFVVRKLMERYVEHHCLPTHRAVLQNIGPGDTVLDLGANVGLFSTYFAARGASVRAYEPDPSAFSILDKQAHAFPTLQVHQEAVFDSDGEMTLYRHLNFKDDPNYAQSSTLIGEKRNVDSSFAIKVPVRDIAGIIASIPGRITLIKMDIEGAEAAVLRRLLDSDLMSRIDHIFVETHEDIVPGLGEELVEIKRRMQKAGYSQVDYSWY